MAEHNDAPNYESNSSIDPRQRAQELLRTFRQLRRITQADVAKNVGCSRITVTRFEGPYDGLPKKRTPKARLRFVKLLLQGYRLYRDEANKIFELLEFGVILDEEWRKHSRPMPHFASILSEVSDKEGDPRFQILISTFGFHMIHAELGQARKIGEELLAIAEQQGVPEFLLDSFCALGACLFHVGELTLAQTNLERAAGQSRTRHDPRRVSFHPVSDAQVLSSIFLGHTLWFTGYPDQAEKKIREAAKSSMDLPLSDRGCIQFLIGAYYSARLDVDTAREYAQTGVLLSAEFGSSHWAAKSGIILGWAQAMSGQVAEGIEQMQRSLNRLREDRPHLAQPYYLCLLAEAHGNIGQIAQGLQVLAEAREMMRHTGEYVWEAVIHITEGKLHRLSGDEASAIQGFMDALGAAHRQKARALELRAATNLASAWKSQGKVLEARCALQTVLDQFTEGFDTPDLIEARMVLETL